MTVIKGPPAPDGLRPSICRQMLGPHKEFYKQSRQKQPPWQGGWFLHFHVALAPAGPQAPARPAHARKYMGHVGQCT